jgi:hypothetical protein
MVSISDDEIIDITKTSLEEMALRDIKHINEYYEPYEYPLASTLAQVCSLAFAVQGTCAPAPRSLLQTKNNFPLSVCLRLWTPSKAWEK